MAVCNEAYDYHSTFEDDDLDSMTLFLSGFSLDTKQALLHCSPQFLCHEHLSVCKNIFKKPSSSAHKIASGKGSKHNGEKLH